jgi:hypothetical protein
MPKATKSTEWVQVHRAEELLGISRKELFRMRDDGTLKLGPHFASFPETRSRDTYRWNVRKVRKALDKMALATPVA